MAVLAGGETFFWGGARSRPGGFGTLTFFCEWGGKRRRGRGRALGKEGRHARGWEHGVLIFFVCGGGMLEGYLGVVDGHYGVGGWGGFYLLAEVGEAGEVGTEEPAAEGGFGVETELLEDGHG